MADNTPEVKVRFGAEGTEAIVSAIRQLTTSLDGMKRKQDEVAKSSISMKGAFNAIVGSAVAMKLVELGKEAFQTAINVGKLAEQTGVSAKTLSVMGLAANHLGITTEDMGKGVIKLERNLVALQQGNSKAADSFALAGLKAKDFVGLSTDQKVLKVVNALGSMKSGAEKTAAATALLGKSGAELLPAMNRLAGEGFAEVTKEAEKLGLALDQDTVSAAMATAASLDTIEEATKGMVLQFEVGLMPALADAADALTDATTGKGVSGFRTLGNFVGTIIKEIVFGFLAIGKAVGALAAEIVEKFSFAWNEIKVGAGAVWESFKKAFSGDFSGAWSALKQGSRQGVQIAQDYATRVGGIFSTLGSDLKQDFLNLFDPDRLAAAQAKRVGSQKRGTEGTTPPVVDQKAASAQLAALRAALELELALFRSNAAQKAQDDKTAYDRGLISLQEYFDRRRAAIQADRDKEIATLQAERGITANAPTRTTADEIAKKTKLAEIDGKIAKLRIDSTTKEKALDQELYQAKEAAQNKLLDFQNEIANAQGRTFDAAIARIQQESEEIRKALVQAGLSPENVAAMIAAIQTARTTSAKWDEEQREGSRATFELGNARQQVENEIASGKILEIDRERELARVEAARVENLRKIAQAMLTIAKLSGDPQKILEAEKFSKDIDAIAISSDFAAQQWAKFKNSVVGAGIDSLTNFFTTGIQNAKSLGDAFKGLAMAVVQSLQQIAAQMLATIIMQKLMKSLGGAFGFSEGGLVPAYADGGLVSGPGTGTSDSIPARLSAGEFVVRAAAVEKIGVGALAMINRGIQIPALAGGYGIPHFADGGLVQAGSARDAMDLRLGLGLDSGLILRFLESKSAGKVIVQQLGENSKSATKALNRG